LFHLLDEIAAIITVTVVSKIIDALTALFHLTILSLFGRAVAFHTRISRRFRARKEASKRFDFS